MTTWILIAILLSGHGPVAMNTIDGFKNLDDCQRTAQSIANNAHGPLQLFCVKATR